MSDKQTTLFNYLSSSASINMVAGSNLCFFKHLYAFSVNNQCVSGSIKIYSPRYHHYRNTAFLGATTSLILTPCSIPREEIAIAGSHLLSDRGVTYEEGRYLPDLFETILRAVSQTNLKTRSELQEFQDNLAKLIFYSAG